MKKLFLLALFFAGAVSAATVNERNYEECTQSCSVMSYTFSADAMGQCRQVESCTLFTWDEENAQCVVKERNVLRTFPIQCRDIPAY